MELDHGVLVMNLQKMLLFLVLTIVYQDILKFVKIYFYCQVRNQQMILIIIMQKKVQY